MVRAPSARAFVLMKHCDGIRQQDDALTTGIGRIATARAAMRPRAFVLMKHCDGIRQQDDALTTGIGRIATARAAMRPRAPS